MSETLGTPEPIQHPDPILDLAVQTGIIITPYAQAALEQLKPRMLQEEKVEIYTALHDALQLAEDENEDTDLIHQIRRQIGITLMAAHTQYATDGTWPEVSEELNNAYYMANEWTETYDGFTELTAQIDELIIALAQRQYKL